MRQIRFLHTSDWQLGMTRHFLAGEAQARYSAARIDVIRTIARLAREQECDFVVVAGDVFDSNLLGSQTVRRALEAMREFTCPVYLLPGNHDALDAVSLYRTALFEEACPAQVHAILGPGLVPVMDGVELVAAPLFSKRPLIDLAADALQDVPPPAASTIRILVAHGQVETVAPPDGNPAVLRLAPLEKALDDGRISYVALGDRHSRLSVGRTGRIHYSGSPEVTAFRDECAGDVLVAELDSSGECRVEPHHVGTWQFVTLHRAVDTADDVDQIAAEVADLAGKDRTVLQTAFAGTLSLADKMRLDELLITWADTLAGLVTWERHTDLAVVVDESALSDLGVSGFVADAVAQLGEAASAGDRAAADALSLLYRLTGGGAR